MKALEEIILYITVIIFAVTISIGIAMSIRKSLNPPLPLNAEDSVRQLKEQSHRMQEIQRRQKQLMRDQQQRIRDMQRR